MKFSCCLLFVVFGAFSLCSCALPVSESIPRQTFVPNREIQVVEEMRTGAYLFGQSRFVEAEEHFRIAQRLSPEATPILLSLGSALERQGIFDEARELYQGVIKKYPEGFDAIFALGKLENAAKKYKTAKQAFEKAFLIAATRPDNANAALVLKSLAVMSFSIGDEESAVCYSAQSLDFKSDSNEIVRHARLLTALGRLNEAYQFLTVQAQEKSLVKDPSILLERAVVAYGLGDIKAARDLSRTAALAGIAQPSSSPEATLLDEILLTDKERSELSDDEKEERLERLTTALTVANGVQATASLFWPVRLIEASESLSRTFSDEIAFGR